MALFPSVRSILPARIKTDKDTQLVRQKYNVLKPDTLIAYLSRETASVLQPDLIIPTLTCASTTPLAIAFH